MTEQPDRLERDLKAMLAVDPSPDLQAQIRARAFSAPPKRAPWLAWASGLAAATAAVLLIAIYSGPEVIPNPPAIAESRETPQPGAIIETPAPVRQSGKLRQENKPTTQPTVVLVPAPTVAEMLPPAEIRVPALKALELTSWIQPIPQEPFPIAGLQQINIEPPTLTVPNLGVQQ